jgi:hypothetical protein
MSVEWAARRVLYTPIPKVACTTLKHIFYFLNFGHEFKPGAGLGNIHEEYAGTPEFRHNRLALYASWRRLVVVRDPILRFLSAYASRVIDFDELSDSLIGDRAFRFKVPIRPNIHQFVEFFNIYKAISPQVQHHFESQAYFAGSNIEAYTHVFKIENLDSLSRMLATELGAPLELPSLQGSTTKISIDEISVREMNEIRSWYAGDYALLRGHYSAEELLAKRSSRRNRCGANAFGATMKDLLPSFDMSITGSVQITEDTAIYLDGCVGSAIIRHGDSLTIATDKLSSCIVGFERTFPNFLDLGESYEIAIEAYSEFATNVTCFVRCIVETGEAVYLGTTYIPLEPGHTRSNVLLDTDVRAAILPCGQSRLQDVKFILMFEAATGIRVQLTRLHLRFATL